MKRIKTDKITEETIQRFVDNYTLPQLEDLQNTVQTAISIMDMSHVISQEHQEQFKKFRYILHCANYAIKDKEKSNES